MFNFAWSEILLIGVVALVLIGPKDLPVAMRAVARVIKRLRRMASEFQGHVDEMMREADLAEMRDVINDVRQLDIRGRVANALDPDRSVSRALRDGLAPLAGEGEVRPARSPRPEAPPMREESVPFRSASAMSQAEAPSFIPPGAIPPAQIQPAPMGPLKPAAPSFIPPDQEGA